MTHIALQQAAEQRLAYLAWLIRQLRERGDDLSVCAADAIEAFMEGAVGPDKYGCHLDLDPGQAPDGCVFDEGRIDDCVCARMLAKHGKGRDDCSYWAPLTLRGAR
jgi:hypothetical protein